jgi:hypothetical protein
VCSLTPEDAFGHAPFVLLTPFQKYRIQDLFQIVFLRKSGSGDPKVFSVEHGCLNANKGHPISSQMLYIEVDVGMRVPHKYLRELWAPQSTIQGRVCDGGTADLCDALID